MNTAPARCTLPSRLSELRSQQPRPLSTQELRRLHQLGFETLALQLAAGACEKCGMNKLGTGHKQMCAEPEEKRNPEPVTYVPPQPWEARPSRQAPFKRAA